MALNTFRALAITLEAAMLGVRTDLEESGKFEVPITPSTSNAWLYRAPP
jgi:hypothetical protein